MTGAALPSSGRLRTIAVGAGVRRRFAPHQLRHAHAVEMAREGVPLVVIQRQLGHVNLGITSIYLQGIDNAEIIDTVHHRPPPGSTGDPGQRRTSHVPVSRAGVATYPCARVVSCS